MKRRTLGRLSAEYVRALASFVSSSVLPAGPRGCARRGGAAPSLTTASARGTVVLKSHLDHRRLVRSGKQACAASKAGFSGHL